MIITVFFPFRHDLLNKAYGQRFSQCSQAIIGFKTDFYFVYLFVFVLLFEN